jgi:hypothetical protein
MHQDISLASAEGEPDVAALLALSNSQFDRLAALCAGILGETARATQDLSERLSFLREQIEALSDDGGPPALKSPFFSTRI